MIEGLKPYAEYKESGLDWLGRVPGSWEVRRLSTVARFYSGKAHEPFFEATGRHICVTARFVSTDGKARKFCTQNFCPTLKGDVLMVMSDLPNGRALARAFFVNDEASYAVNQRVCLIRANKMNPKFLAYQANRSWWLLQNDDHCNQTHLSNRDYKTLPLLSPPPDEQAAIVRFLDHANRKIDGFIRAKRKLIGLLNEQKQAIIHRAVTRGLHPDVPLKPSGIPWLGDIPAHWETPLNRQLFRENVRQHNGRTERQLSLSQRDGLIATEDMKERSLQTSSFDNWKVTIPGDLVLNRFKAHLGVFFASTLRGIVSFHYGVFEPQRKLNTKYFELLCHTAPYKVIYAGRSNGMTVGLQNLSNQNFYGVRSIVPPLNEQNEIVNYSETATVDLNTAIARTEREIALMQEYRTRLTADLVTGKLDVREAAAKLPAPPTEAVSEPIAADPLEEIDTEEIEA